MATERVQKILAQAGISSRRKAEELIQLGEVTINGKIAKLGDKAEWGKDSIKVRGKLLVKAEAPMYVALYKPRGVICALTDPDNRPTLADYLGKIRTRLFTVGRLDFNSEGLILLTNDGDFAEKVQKQEQLPRSYMIKVKGHPEPEMIARIERGGRVGDDRRKRHFKPYLVKVAQKLQNKTVIQVVILGAGAFDIKSLFEERGFLVEKVLRNSIGHLTVNGLVPGGYRMLKASQVQALLTQPELGMRELTPPTPRRS